MSISIQVTVKENILGAFESLAEEYPSAVGAAIMRVADRVMETANVLVPVRSGFLKSSLGYRQDSNFQVTFYALAPYSQYVEFGTSRLAARLFLTRSLQQHQEEFPEVVKNALMRLFEGLFGT